MTQACEGGFGVRNGPQGLARDRNGPQFFCAEKFDRFDLEPGFTIAASESTPELGPYDSGVDRYLLVPGTRLWGVHPIALGPVLPTINSMQGLRMSGTGMACAGAPAENMKEKG